MSPSYLKRILILCVRFVFLKARRSSTAAYTPNRVGVTLHPCFTPLLYLMGSDRSLLIISCDCTSVYYAFITWVSLGGQPSFCRMVKRRSWFTQSKALLKSVTAMCRFCLCSLLFSIISVRCHRQDFCFSWKLIGILVKCWSCCKRMSAKAFPTTLGREIPR